MFISLVPHYYKLFAITDTKSPPKGSQGERVQRGIHGVTFNSDMIAGQTNMPLTDCI